MKHFKTLGLLAIAMTALMAFAPSSPATTLTSPTGTTFNTSTFTAIAGTTSLDAAQYTVTCNKSHTEATISQHGPGVTIKANVAKFTFTECNFPVKVEANGTLELHTIRRNFSPHATCLAGDGDTCDGTLTSSGTKMTIETSVGNCTFTTNETSIGRVTGSSTTGGKAKLDIQASIPRTGGNFLCGSSYTWTGSYTFDTPNTLWIDES
jgi:hypothetical protein